MPCFVNIYTLNDLSFLNLFVSISCWSISTRFYLVELTLIARTYVLPCDEITRGLTPIIFTQIYDFEGEYCLQQGLKFKR